MKLKTKQQLTKNFFALSLIMFFISIYTIKSLDNYEIEYKKEIQDKFNRDFTLALNENESNATGEYFFDTQNILIYTKNRYVWSVERTAYHEIGHYIYCVWLNESQRNEWELLYDNSISHYGLNDSEEVKLLMNGSSYFVSDYAEIDAEQDFAESYSAFRLKFNKLDFRKELFMEEYVRELI